MKKITFIYCFRDRELIRVKLSLDSLAAQTDMNFNVIFVDYGSEMSLASKVNALTREFPFVKYVYNDTRLMMWNRSHALNTAIHGIDTPYVFTADIDMIFKPGFVEMMNSIVDNDKAFFFSAIMLPENMLPGNTELEKGYPRTSDNALGWGLIPSEHLQSMGGYDEVYCIWGKEDNDIGHRLVLAGVEVVYVSDIWMFHYYHPPVPQQRKVLPEDWFMFLQDYFDFSIHTIKRNDGNHWGECLSETDRPALNHMNVQSSAFVPINGRCRFFRYILEVTFDQTQPGSVIKFVFTDKVAESFKSSNLFKVTEALNKGLMMLKVPFQFTTKYSGRYEDIYFARNELMYFLITRKNEIQDYAYELTGDTIKVAVVKKSTIKS